MVRTSLEREGWVITHDPYFLEFGKHDLQVDIGAEMPLAAEREGRKIAVEIKSFRSSSVLTEFYTAYGQFDFYRNLMKDADPERILYLAMPYDAFHEIFDIAAGENYRQRRELDIIIYHTEGEEPLQWIE